MEIFKPIKDYEGIYEIGSHGTIKGLDRLVNNRGKLMKVKGVVVKPVKSGWNKNYYSISLRKDGIRTPFNVHRLVARHFLEDFTEEMQVNHKDRNTFNNNVSNLEMVTAKENMKHADENGFGFGRRKVRNCEGKVFESLSEACKYIGKPIMSNGKYNSSGISRAIKTNGKYYNYNWFYV